MGPNHGRKLAKANRPASDPQTPLPVDHRHRCYCGRGGFSPTHNIGAHPEFWDNMPKQGVTI